MKKKRSKFKGYFGPFCVHFYPKSYSDFPLVEGPFEYLEDALDCAASNNYFELVRLGCWTNKVMTKGYYHLEPLEIQVKLI